MASPAMKIVEVRPLSTLTASYVAGNVIDIFGIRQATILVAYTQGTGESGNSIQIKIELSDDNTNWYQEVSTYTSGNTSSLRLHEYSFDAVSAAGTYDRFALPVPIGVRYVRISIKETGVATNFGTAGIKLVKAKFD